MFSSLNLKFYIKLKTFFNPAAITYYFNIICGKLRNNKYIPLL